MNKNTKIKVLHTILCGTLISLSQACMSAVDSDELSSTKASDLRIEGSIQEFDNDEDAQVSAQMQTKRSETAINFTQGESLTVQSDTPEGSLSASTSLSEDDEFIDLDQSYEGYVAKTAADGNYYITYTDEEGTSTTATIPTFSAPTMTSPVEGATVDTNSPVLVTWNSSGIVGSVYIYTTYSGSGYFGSSKKSVDNDGSEEIRITSHKGSGSISVVQENSFNSFAGFAEAKIYMKNTSRVNVSYITSSSTPSLAMISPEGESEKAVKNLIEACQRECSEGEEELITIGDEIFDCCLY